MEDVVCHGNIVTLTNDEILELKTLIQKGGKGYRIRHAQILLNWIKDQKIHGRMTVSRVHMVFHIPSDIISMANKEYDGIADP